MRFRLAATAALIAAMTVAGATGVAAQEGTSLAQARAAGEAGAIGAAVGGTAVVEREALVMGTRLYGRVEAGTRAEASAALEAALSAARGVESWLSTWRPDTELSRVNGAPVGEAVELSTELYEALVEASRWVTETGGAFDPAVGALVDAWGVRGDPAEPSAESLAAAVRSTGWDRVTLDRDARTLTREAEGVWLDAGGFGKGLALRAAERELRSRGAWGVLNFGGQVLVVESPAGVSSKVDVAGAADRSAGVASLRLEGGSVATTSSSERGGHVLDPRTGRPVRPWGSVTVVASDPFTADVLSTALFVMGPDAALEWSWGRPYGVLVQRASEDGSRIEANPAMERWLEADRSAAAQDTTELARLRRQVEAITRELERMRLGGDVVARADTGVLGFGPAASKVYKVAEGVSIGGYGEILYEWYDDELEDGAESATPNVFDALRAIIYVGYKFSDKLLFNSEIELEHADEAYLEFAYLDYRLSEALGLRGGLLLAPMGLVNELHEPPVFLGTTRPMVEQQIIPTTWRENGFGVFGAYGPFSYRAYVMNGLNGADGFSRQGLRGARQKGSKAIAEDLGYVARVDYEGILGLLVGGSLYRGESDQGARITIPGEEREVEAMTTIWEGHAAYQAGGFDLRALVAGATVDDALGINLYRIDEITGASSVGEKLEGGYVHAGYDVFRWLDTDQQLYPYFRYEWTNTQVEVPAGYTSWPGNDKTALLLGASWKPVPQVAIKGDYQIHTNEAETGRNQFAMVLSWLF